MNQQIGSRTRGIDRWGRGRFSRLEFTAAAGRSNDGCPKKDDASPVFHTRSMSPILTISHALIAEEALHLRDEGFCPIECSFGDESVVDELQMDHHGPLSHLEGVAIRAYRDHFGTRCKDPRFVVTGGADADATFAIAALAGLLPHPSRGAEFNNLPEYLRAAGSRDLTELAVLINRADLDPIGLRLEESVDGLLLLLFKRLSSGVQDIAGLYAGVDHWRLLLGPNPPVQLLEAVGGEERQRVAEARAAQVQIISQDVAIVESRAWGYDVWYAEGRPVIVAYQAGKGHVSVGCRDLATAHRLFGLQGLRAAFPHLQPPGWGGRETIGGSPRSVRLEREQALAAAMQLVSHIQRQCQPVEAANELTTAVATGTHGSPLHAATAIDL